MSQSTPNSTSVVMNAAGSRQQVPLRDYLNARVAPFLKKAITESLGVEAEFPLQWLGECLIHQSILYEGNPDRTNIRDRFINKFEDPKPQEEPVTVPAPAPAPADEPSGQSVETAPPVANIQEQAEATMNEDTPATAEPTSHVPEPAGEAETAQAPPVINGVNGEDEQSHQSSTRDGDTEMGGVS